MLGGVGPFRQGKPLVLPTPELDAYEKELRARSHRKVTYAGVACILLFMPLFVLYGMATVPTLIEHVKHPLHAPSQEAQERARKAIAAARTRAAEEEAAASRGIAAAIRDGVTAHPELGRCPYAHSSGLAHDDPFSPTSFARADDASVCRTCRQLLSRAAELEASLSVKSRDDDLDAAIDKRIAGLRHLGQYNVVLKVDREVAAHGTPHVDFMPGLVVGRAFVWDTERHAVVCAGPVRAESSEVVDYTYTTQNGVDVGSRSALDSALERDLHRRTERAVADGLRYVAGPRIADED